MLALPAGRLTTPAAPADADLLVAIWSAGTLLQQLPISARTSLDACAVCRGDADSDANSDGDCDAGSKGGSNADSSAVSPITGFTAILPATSSSGAPIDRLVVGPAGAQNATALQIVRSASAPQIAFTSPSAPVLGSSTVHVAWHGLDADGDALTYYLRFSPDGATRFVPILTSTRLTQADVDLSTLPALVDGKGCFELFASDGLNTTVIRTPALSLGPYFKGTLGNAPWVQMVSPDNATPS